MRKFYLLSTLVLAIICGSSSYAQDFSNKGKEFYLCFPSHVPSGNPAQMSLFITSDRNSSGTVTYNGQLHTFLVTANTVTEVPIVRASAYISDAESNSAVNKGIRVKVNTGQPAVVVYSHIYAGFRTAATLVLPVNVLGKKYRTTSYFQASTGNSKSQFQIIAVEPNTQVQVQLRKNGALSGLPFTVSLPNVGDVYQIQDNLDLTGSFLESIAGASGSCKKIAVFSGSSALSLGRLGCNGGSFDPLNQQCYPISTWGKNFGVIPIVNNQNGYQARVLASEDNTSVNYNGAPVVLNAGEFYPASSQNVTPQTTPIFITANKPISVAQYLMSQNCAGSPQIGDPDMIILNPIEQNIKDVTLFTSTKQAILQQHMNILIKTIAAPSFRINGAVPPGAFIPMPANPAYSYLQHTFTPVGQNSITLTADSGFNAICYGLGDAESYGYSGGTNVKDLYQQIGTTTQYGGASSPSVCVGSSTKFKISLPYAPDSIYWDFRGSQSPNVMLSSPPVPITPDSITTINGRSVYWYSLPLQYTFNTTGTFPATITTFSQNPDGCGTEQEIEIDVEVYNTPVADFNFTTDGCVSNPVAFFENNNTARPLISRYWNFGDASINTTSNPTHTYPAAGSYNVKYSFINDIGCIADTASHTVTLNDPPLANFSVAAPYCAGIPVNFTNLSTPVPGGTYAWTFGDAGTSSAQNPSHTYTTAGTYTVTLVTTSASGCTSLPHTFDVTISPKPIANFSLPVACLPAGTAQFNDLSTPGAGNTITSWAWTFGDAGTSTSQNPLHTYTTTGPFTVNLTVTSNNGCTDIKTQTLNTVYAEPQAIFTAPADVCLGSVVNFSDGSNAPGSSVTGWSWNFGDGNTSSLQNPTHTYTTAGPFTVTLNVTSAAGCATVNNFATRTVSVRTLPTATISGGAAASVCQNATGPSITFTGAGGTSPYTFNYTIDNGSGPVAQPPITTVTGNSITITASTSTPGTYRYALVSVREGSTAACNQPQASFVDVQVRPFPGAIISGATEVCLNATSPNITFTGSNGIAPYSFNYRINGGPVQTITTTSGNSVTVAVPTTASGTFAYELVNVTESSPGNCTQNFTGLIANVIVKPPPTATMIGSAEVCLNSSAHNITFTGGGGTPPYQFRYRIVGDPTPFYTATTSATSSSVQVPVPTTTAGTFTYQLLSVQEGSASACGQPQSSTVTTTINPLPTADFTAASPNCESRAITFNDISVPNAGNIVAWDWDFGDGNTSNLQSPSHVYSVAGLYTVKLNVTTDKGCVSTIVQKNITVNINPKADFTPPVACVADVSAQFTDLGNVNPGSVTGWEWDFGDPNATPANPNTSTAQNPTHHFTVAGPYNVRQIVISNTGCRDTLIKTFTVNDLPVSNFTIENVGSVCSNQAVTIKDAATTTFGSISKVEVFWDYLNDPTAKVTDASPVSAKMYTYSYPEFGTPASRTFRIRYVAYTGNNCISSFERDVTLLATPTLVFAAVPGVCSDVPAFQITQAQMVNALPGGPGIFSGKGVSPTGLFDPAVAGAGSHLIRFTYNATNGCSNFIERTIEVYPDPSVNAGPDKVVLEGGQVTLTPALSIGGPSVTYLWTPVNGLNNPAILSPVASPQDDITYTLTVTTDKGCTDDDQVFVKVLKSPLIPNIFSPNGDRIHDSWQIPYLESYPGCTIDLYNRYGQLVYHSVGYSTPWDGKVNGKDVPVGTYYYVIDPKNGRSKLTGYVDVIR